MNLEWHKVDTGVDGEIDGTKGSLILILTLEVRESLVLQYKPPLLP